MIQVKQHSFLIPVMGLGYTIDTPIKVARFGINSVVSVIQDHLVEQMREHYCKVYNEEYIEIPIEDDDHRAKRVTAYLDLIKRIVDKQFAILKSEEFNETSELTKFFRMLPDYSYLKAKYNEMLLCSGEKKVELQQYLRNAIEPGSIDINIMTKTDKLNYGQDKKLLPPEYSDASAVLRGFALSNLSSSVVFSAGMNPRLYSYIEKFDDFFPNENRVIRKKVVIKVSDFRSARIQGKFLAKKGIWVSEFRIESGLNCGGHAFPTNGLLMGPILQEFADNRVNLNTELLSECNTALKTKGKFLLDEKAQFILSAQGGIGTHEEDEFLLNYYNVDYTGWGSPFLLVPEATNVDNETLNELTKAKKEDYFLSFASPLGIPFNNFKRSSAEVQRISRIEKNRPGSPCYKKFLAFNTEFSEEPICEASREFQNIKLKQLAEKNLSKEEYEIEFNKIVAKDCLCEGLSLSVLLVNQIPDSHNATAVAICPGPNLAYFSKIASLEQMVNHIYGKISLLNKLPRPNMFINELFMYVDYMKNVYNTIGENISAYKINLLKGIEYYQSIANAIFQESFSKKEEFLFGLEQLKNEINTYQTIRVA